jgi:hypothetical protein
MVVITRHIEPERLKYLQQVCNDAVNEFYRERPFLPETDKELIIEIAERGFGNFLDINP